MIKKLEEITDEFYFTTINDSRAMNTELFENITNKKYKIIPDYKDCIELAKISLKNDECLLITGSLHFISTVRQYLIK
jgi:dihydrofolate synthase/folylpolyglutamate synthase